MSDRLELARTVLREAVFASRAKQAAGASLLLARERDGSSSANCGLGRDAAIELGLSEKGRSAFASLWPTLEDASELARIQGCMASWVQRQDQLDRDRNHFLKAFRTRHGFDRRTYGPELSAEFEAGLEEVNGRVTAELDVAARALLDAPATGDVDGGRQRTP